MTDLLHKIRSLENEVDRLLERSLLESSEGALENAECGENYKGIDDSIILSNNVDASSVLCPDIEQKQEIKQEIEDSDTSVSSNQYVSVYEEFNNELIKITLPEGQVERSCRIGITASEIFSDEQEVVAVLSNNELLSLNEHLDINCSLVPIRKDSPFAKNLLHDSASFLVALAVQIVFPQMELHHRYNVGRAQFYEIEGMKCEKDDATSILSKMRQLVEEDIKIERTVLSFNDAKKELSRLAQYEAVELLDSLHQAVVDMAYAHSEEIDFYSLWVEPLLQNLNCLKDCFDVVPYYDGFLLYVGVFEKPVCKPTHNSLQLQNDIYRIHNLHLRLGQLLGFRSIASFNKLLLQPKLLRQLISSCETNYEHQLAEIASHITRSTRAVFLSGPSGSGKTTIANRICCQLRAKNYKPIRLSLDNFYLEEAKIPRIEGTDTPDYEHLEALDLDQIKKSILSLINGDETDIPVYDFVKECEDPNKSVKVKLPESGILVIEGNHALNTSITDLIPDSQKIKVFAEPIGTLEFDELRTIEHKSVRLIRRMCRDYIHKNRSAEQTLEQWDSIIKGEQRWVLPSEVECDYYFNSGMTYELFVLKVFAVPLLRQVSHESINYPKAKYLLRLLQPLLPIEIDYVPENSLLREFLPGGSEYEDFFF